MKNRRKYALAIRLVVDDHDIARYEVYERATNTVLFTRMLLPTTGKHAHNSLSILLAEIKAIG